MLWLHKALSKCSHIHTFTHTFIHWWQWLSCKVQIQCFSKTTFLWSAIHTHSCTSGTAIRSNLGYSMLPKDILTHSQGIWGSNYRPSNYCTTHATSWATAAEKLASRSDSLTTFLCLMTLTMLAIAIPSESPVLDYVAFCLSKVTKVELKINYYFDWLWPCALRCWSCQFDRD